MNDLDLILLLGIVALAFLGYRRGLISSCCTIIGLVGGAMVGIIVAPTIAQRFLPQLPDATIAVAMASVGAIAGEILCSMVGSTVRSHVRWRPARFVDGMIGAVLNVGALLLVTWFIASVLLASNWTGIQQDIRRSTVLTSVDKVMPDSARSVFTGYRSMLASSAWPSVYWGLGAAEVASAEPPDPDVVADAGVSGSEASVFKVRGYASGCSRNLEGTGFAFATHRILTNAHVVAGVTRPSVADAAGHVYSASVVAFDSRKDVAVLDVPGLVATALSFGVTPGAGDSVAIGGYPSDGPFEATPARVRQTQSIHGTDIYGKRRVDRQVVSLYAMVHPGNSGSPLIDDSGRVVGMVFAASRENDNTAYAIPVADLKQSVAGGAESAAPVGTGSCP